MVFLVACGVYITTGIVNVVFGKFEVQWWNTYWEADLKIDDGKVEENLEKS